MLDVLLVAGAAIAIAVIAAVAYAALKPDAFSISRSIVIAAPPEAIFPLISDLHEFNRWNPFARKDPAIAISYSGPASGVGATHHWEGDANVGKGRLSIVDVTPPHRVGLRLEMEKPMAADNQVEFLIEPEGSLTRVSWTMRGRQPLLGRVVCLVVDMDRMVGADFETGLASLKALAEQRG